MPIEAVQVPEVRSRVWTAEDARQAYELLTQDQAVKYGEYETESKARTQGQALDRLIAANHGRRFGVSVWKDQNGQHIGALLPREPHKRTRKGGKRS